MRTIAWRVVAVAISVALLAWVAASGRWQGVGARLQRVDAIELGGIALLFAASYAMRGARIHGEFCDELVASGHGPGSYPRILRLTLVHNALVNVLPFRSGEVAFPMLLSRWFGIGTGRAVVSLLWLRAQDATVVLALAALVWPGLPMLARVAALIAIVAGAALVPLWARRLRPGSSSSALSSSSRLAKLPALLERATRRNVAGWSWTVANWTVKLIAETWLMALVLGSGASRIATAALGAIGSELAAILPVQGVAGFGTFEAGGAALMRTQDVALDTGLEAALALHAVVLALALIAGLVAAVALPGPRVAHRPPDRS